MGGAIVHGSGLTISVNFSKSLYSICVGTC